MPPALDRLVGTWRLAGRQLDGAVREWESREKDGTWIVTQAGRAGPGEPRTRCTLELGDGGRTMTGNWEYSNDGLTWRTFWDVRATKETR